MKFYIYDLETLNNCFLFTGKFLGESNIQVFELSFRKNMHTELSQFLSTIKQMGAIMVGYNNLGFDYPITHQLMHNPSLSYRDWETDRKSTRLNSSHSAKSRMPSSA